MKAAKKKTKKSPDKTAARVQKGVDALGSCKY